MPFLSTDDRHLCQALAHIAPWMNQDEQSTLLYDGETTQIPPWLTPIVTYTTSGKASIFAFSPDQSAIPPKLQARLGGVSTQKITEKLKYYWQLAIDHTPVCSLMGSTALCPAGNSSIYRIYGSSLGDVEGDSIGLAITLAYIQYVSHTPLSCSLLTSATINEDGELGRVEKLSEKLSLLAYYPHLNHVAVCASQEEEAQEAISHLNLDRYIKISTWSTLDQALQDLFTSDIKRDWQKKVYAALQPETAVAHLVRRVLYNRLGGINKNALCTLLESIESQFDPNHSLKSSLIDALFIIKRHLGSEINSAHIQHKLDILSTSPMATN